MDEITAIINLHLILNLNIKIVPSEFAKYFYAMAPLIRL